MVGSFQDVVGFPPLISLLVIQLSHLSTATIAEMLQICGHSMFFHSLLLTAFSTKNNLFGERIPADSETVVNGTHVLTAWRRIKLV